MKELHVIKEQIKEDLRQEMRQVMRQELASLRLPQENANPQPSHSLVHVSSDGSCDAKDVSNKDLHTPEKCELYVEDPLHLVAIGNVYKLGPTIHHKQIEDDKEIVGSKKDVSPQQLTPQVDPLTRLCIVAMNISKQPIQLSLEPDVIGKPTPIPFFIHQKDILELLMG
ncbi:hypothetical protein SESBI_31970 [Sesbania bispinosa]|nr:hypothetical protein SESBI_31970 [Sesbania bispinosa]